MEYVGSTDRAQMNLMCLDDLMGQDNICRVIDAFCETLDMKTLGFVHAETAETGRPSYDPKALLKLYLYGYLNRISSSGGLAREAERNVEVMWLIGRLTPSKRTLCYFRAQNAGVLKKVFREFNQLYRKLGLFGGETLTVDSVKLRANNSKRNNYSLERVKTRLLELDATIERYLRQLEENDAAEDDAPDLSPEEIRKAIAALTDRKDKYTKLQAKMDEGKVKEISTVDADSRLMRQGSGKGFDVSYNTQVATDEKNKMVVAYETTNQANDTGRLEKITEEAKAVVGKDKVTVLADSGYYDTRDILSCEEKGTTCLVPEVDRSPKNASGEYTREGFRYDAEQNAYICPAEQKLPYKETAKQNNGRQVMRYWNKAACKDCPIRANCTKSKFGRKITRWVEQEPLDAINERFRQRLREYDKRSAIAEHPFGTIKWGWGFNRYQTRGMGKVDGENALLFCAYNLRRAVNILGVKALLEALACANLRLRYFMLFIFDRSSPLCA